MASKTICFGFDGICADMSFFIKDLPKHRTELCIKYPFLDPVFDKLLGNQPEDCELQIESAGFGFETFFDCIYSLSEIAQKKTTRIGANAAIETITAMNLMKDPVYPIDYTKIYFLGNFSKEVAKKVPREQRIDPVFLEHANYIQTSYIPISIILPYKGRRGIISFGGMPGIRRIQSLKPYLQNLSSIIDKINPDIMSILGTTNVYSTTEDLRDFDLLKPFLNLRNSLVDLGGTIGWDYGRLERFYRLLNDAKIVIGNAEEFKGWYNFKFGESVVETDPVTLYRMVSKLRKDQQIIVCHTKDFQFVLGLDSEKKEIIRDCMNFANKATVVKSSLSSFPTARQIEEAALIMKSGRIPELLLSNTIYTQSVDQEIVNPVGLGDVWSCTFCLGLLSQGIL